MYLPSPVLNSFIVVIYYTQNDYGQFLHTEECAKFNSGRQVNIPRHVHVNFQPTYEAAKIILQTVVRGISVNTSTEGLTTIELKPNN